MYISEVGCPQFSCTLSTYASRRPNKLEIWGRAQHKAAEFNVDSKAEYKLNLAHVVRN